MAVTIAWKHPYILTGIPVDRYSITERFRNVSNMKEEVFRLMEVFFYRYSPDALMLISWEELDKLVGLWVKPAENYPGKAGAHFLTEDMRDLGGPFLFGECATSTRTVGPGKIMIACPINNGYDSWGYVAVVVDDTEDLKRFEDLVHFLAHRILNVVY